MLIVTQPKPKPVCNEVERLFSPLKTQVKMHHGVLPLITVVFYPPFTVAICP